MMNHEVTGIFLSMLGILVKFLASLLSRQMVPETATLGGQQGSAPWRLWSGPLVTVLVLNPENIAASSITLYYSIYQIMETMLEKEHPKRKRSDGDIGKTN